MSVPDIINGLFESSASIFILMSIIRLSKDKKVRGMHWLTNFFFWIWGYWNLFYYPHLGQWVSLVGGVCVVITNTVWMIQIFYFNAKEKRGERR